MTVVRRQSGWANEPGPSITSAVRELRRHEFERALRRDLKARLREVRREARAIEAALRALKGNTT